MPEWVPRSQLVCALLAGAVASGCSGRKDPAPETVTAPPPEVAQSIQKETLRQAQEALDEGIELAEGANWSEARLAFDRAVDLLLSMPGGVQADPEAAALYDEVIATIHETERASLDAFDDALAETEQSDTAAVDLLTSEALLEEENASIEVEDLAPPETTYDIPIEMNARVRSLIEMYETRKHDWFQAALDRSALYMPMVREVFREEGLPQDLIYLALVESAFKTRAVSRAGARGIWQFIQGTGRLYGLKQTFWVDDRFNPEKATRAAARHLKDLYEEFGDWYLVMAAYNSGQRRVERAIRRTGSRDFWVHAKQRRLPRETRSYVPLILAAIVVAKNPEAHGFTAPSGGPIDYEVVRLEHPVDLSTAAKSAGTTIDEMKLLNPELRRWVTPLDDDDYPLRIPKGQSEVFRTALAAIPENERVRFGTHVVRRGDTLSRIAARYGTSVAALTSANRISRRSLIHPGQVLTVPVPPGSGGRTIRNAQRREIVAEDGQEIYIVRRGDTLGAISEAFGMGLSTLRRVNGMSSRATRIYPGQQLIVTERGAEKLAARGRIAPAPAPTGTGTYVVQPGDTLGEIAEAHGMGLSVLRRLNGFSSRQARIYPGQRLKVSTGASASSSRGTGAGTVSYRIRRGDTLEKIARRYGVSVSELRQWNGMRSDRIVAGEKLTIHVPADMN